MFDLAGLGGEGRTSAKDGGGGGNGWWSAVDPNIFSGLQYSWHNKLLESAICITKPQGDRQK